MPTVHLVQPSSTGKIKFITLTLENDTLTRVWGLMGCKTQTTSNTYKTINEGKANELNPARAAKADFDRLISDKCKEGYKVTESLTAATTAELDTMDFDNPPKSFAPAKPIKKIENEAIDKLLSKGQAIITRKENGLRHFIFIGTKSQITIYTRRMDDHTAKYPHLVDYVKSLKLPPCTVLDTELVVDPLGKYPNHTAAFRLMQSISKKDTTGGKLKADQSESFARQKVNPVRGMVFHILFFEGEPLWTRPYHQIWVRLQGFFPPVEAGAPLYHPIELKLKNSAEVDAWITKNKKDFEGLVIWDQLGVAELVFTGKPKRKACYKRKGLLETDVIAVGYEEGTGENQGKIGAFLIAQYDEKGKLVDLGKCGTGLSDADREISKYKFPFVLMVEYAERFPGGKMQFPCCCGEHPDKKPEECIFEEDE